ncbi:MAG: hypothetical protein LBC74_16035 [Planctomycetaceae bacterium]|jgi:hypothetical protein|nr:hypothetical protein [Planctomycetaceae bacterium]
MRLLTFILCIFLAVLFPAICFGQFLSPLYPRRPQFHEFDPTGEFDFHAGIHSGSWTLRRQQILELESKDPHRSCSDPYCQRCSKHLADYGHEYQYIHGPSQANFWYRNTWKDIAPAVKRGYDEHSYTYMKRGCPAATMSWEYQQVLNHAIWEQLQARNAAEIANAAKMRVDNLKELYDKSASRLEESKAAWDYQVENGVCFSAICDSVKVTCDSVKVTETATRKKKVGIRKSSKNYLVDSCEHELQSSCEYCLVQAKYLKDAAYLREVGIVLAEAEAEAARAEKFAAEWAEIAKLSKPDANIATRFKRIHHKPPRYQEVFAAEGKKVDDMYRGDKQDKETTTNTATTQPENTNKTTKAE